MEEIFWFNDLTILYKKCPIYFPSPKYSLITNLNAIVRFFILYSILCFVIYQNIDVFIPLMLIMIISIILYYFKDYITEPFKNNNNNQNIVTELRKSTPSNPMMNLSVMDYNNNKNIEIDKKITNEEINENLNGNLFDNITDISNKNMFERNFYTTPINTIPNDQTSFAKWLYDKGPTCKEKTTECVNTIPERLSMGRGANSS